MIRSFKNYLIEEEKPVYFTFGRMNPPTIGHEKLMNKLSSLSAKNPYRIYLSQSQDKAKNPLDYKSKIKLARKMFPKHARQILSDKGVKTAIEAAVKLYNEGFKKIVMVVGSDRITEFDTLLNKYNGKKARHGFYNFQTINVVSAGDRDPDADGASGMSASKMRTAAKQNDFTSFAQGLPKSVSNSEAKNTFNQIRKAMGLKEQKEFKNHIQLKPVSETRENYISGELFNEGDMVIIKETGQVANVKHLGSNYVILQDTSRKWLHDVKKVNMENKEGPQDPDIKDMKGTQPKGYYAGLKKGTKKSRHSQFKRQAKMSDDNPAAYKKAPGDSKKTKLSKHTIKFRQMFGDD